MNLNVSIASEAHASYAPIICKSIADSAQERGIGRGKRKIEMIANKITSGQAIIAFYNNEFAGFSYIESWDDDKYVANTGLIIVPKFRSMGLAKKIKLLAKILASQKYPNAQLISLTTSLPVMKLNSDLGYKPVTYSELPKDQNFWNACQSCPNFKALKDKNFKMCFCTAMILSNIQSTISKNNYAQ